MRPFLRLRDRCVWALIVVEAHWLAAPPPVRAPLRALARLRFLRRWIRVG
ncbi:hypothetical protein [Caulobacter sp. LjRoot300]